MDRVHRREECRTTHRTFIQQSFEDQSEEEEEEEEDSDLTRKKERKKEKRNVVFILHRLDLMSMSWRRVLQVIVFAR